MSWAATRRRHRGSQARVQDALEAQGLTAGRGKMPVAEDPTWGRRLGAALADLRGGFALFGAFLAQRPDVVGLQHALVLEDLELETHFGQEEGPPDGDLQRLHQALPPSAAKRFGDVVPLQQGPLTVSYLSRLREPGGASHDAWVLRLRRSGVQETLASDLSQLEALMPAFNDLASSPMGRRHLQAAMDTFRQWTEHRLDQRQRDESLAAFAGDLADGDLLQVPSVDSTLSSETLSVRQWLDEAPISKTAGAPSAAGLKELGRQLHLAVLEQILVTGHAPLCADWRVQRNGRLVLVDGQFSRLSTASLPRLWSYLQHLAGHRPEDAFEAIEGELRPVVAGAGAHQLRLRMRQLVPFRDGGWSERRDTLAELLALHWCLVGEMGFAPSPALAVLWQSLYHTSAVGRRLELGGDPLRAALEDLRWLATFRRMRHFSDPQEMGQALETHLASLLEMPQKVDRLLQMWSGEGGEDLQLRLRVATDRSTERRRNALYLTLCLAALMLSLAFVGERLPALGLDPAWVEGASAVLFLMLGLWLLRTLTRRDR